MTELENDLLHALLELEEAAQAYRRSGSKPALQPLLARVDQLTDRLPRDSNPNLLHYLHKKSYEKARLLLEDRDADNPRGQCR